MVIQFSIFCAANIMLGFGLTEVFTLVLISQGCMRLRANSYSIRLWLLLLVLYCVVFGRQLDTVYKEAQSQPFKQSQNINLKGRIQSVKHLTRDHADLIVEGLGTHVGERFKVRWWFNRNEPKKRYYHVVHGGICFWEGRLSPNISNWRIIPSFARRYQLNGKILDAHNWVCYRENNSVLQNIIDRLSNFHAGRLALSIVLGQSQYMDVSEYQIFRATGTSHLLAVSGLHIGIITLGLRYIVLQFFTRLTRGLWQGGEILGAAEIFIALILWFYLKLLQYRASACRAAFLWGLGVIFKRLGWQIGMYDLLGFLIIASCLYEPLLVLNYAWLLSYYAILCIIWLNPRHDEAQSILLWYRSLRYQLGFAALQWPVSVLCFGGWSAVGVLANFVLIPFFSRIVMPISLSVIGLSLINSGPILSLGVHILGFFYRFFLYIGGVLSHWSGSYLYMQLFHSF